MLSKPFKYILFFFILCYSQVDAQESISDSLINVSYTVKGDTAQIDFLIKRIWNYRRNNPEVSLALLGYLSKFQEEQNISHKSDVVLYYNGIIHKNIGDFEKAEKYLEQYYSFHEQKQSKGSMSAAKQALCNLYFDQDLYSKSMAAAKDALKIVEQLKDTLTIIRMQGRVGAILCEMNRFEDALQYHSEGLSLSLAVKDSISIGDSYTYLGVLYENMERFDSMLYYYEKSLEIGQALKDDHLLLYANFNLGTANNKMDRLQEAYRYAKQSFEYADAMNDPYIQNYAGILLADINVKMGKAKEGLRILKNFDEEALTLGQKKELYGSFYSGLKAQGKTEQALDYLEKFKTASDSILNQEIAAQISDLKLQYESDQKESKINLLSTKNELYELKIKKTNRQRIYLLIGVLALSLIIGLLYSVIWVNKKTRTALSGKNKEIEKALSEKEVLLKEIHHRVKNNLQVISSLLSLQSRQIADPNAQLALLEGRNRVKSMALIHQNLYQDEDLVGVDPKEYINKLVRGLVSSYKIDSTKIEIQTEIDKGKLDVDTIIPLGLILNELVSNALKYAFKGRDKGLISISLKKEKDLLNLEVSDDGVGLPDGFEIEKLESLGFRLINSFAQKLKAELKINNLSNGVKILMKIPYSKSK